ncbi:hypothetical protein [Eel River basin pequenovirus]|nr:hypothetical protein [Eel River basin pequenovirus]
MVAEYLPAIGKAIGAVGSLTGGNYYQSEALRLQKRELHRNNRNNLWQQRFARGQFDWNKRLNTHGLRMKAYDAKHAWDQYGISPHLSYGAAPMSGSFVSPSLSASSVSGPTGGSGKDFRGLGDAIASMPTRKEVSAARLAEAQGFRHRELQNDLLEAQIEGQRATTIGVLANSTQRAAQTGLRQDGNPTVSLVAEFGHYDKQGKWHFSHYGPNPEAFEIGATEIVAGTGLHGIGAGTAATIDGLVNHRDATRVVVPPTRPSYVVPSDHLPPLQFPKLTHPKYTSRR